MNLPLNLPQIDWTKLIKFEYWFEGFVGDNGSFTTTPVNNPEGFFFYFWLYLFALVLVKGIALRLAQVFLHPQHPLQNKLPEYGNVAITLGSLGLIWFVARQIEISVLGLRAWLLVIFAVALFYKVRFINYLLKYYKLEMQYFKKTYLK